MRSSLEKIIILSAILAISCATGETNSEPEQKTQEAVEKEKALEEPAVAGKVEPEVSPQKPKAESATFLVPEMDEARVKSLVGALANQKGVQEAKPDSKTESLAVTFVPGETNPKEILEVLVKVVPDITLDKVEHAVPGADSKHDCGGCPMRNSCGGSH